MKKARSTKKRSLGSGRPPEWLQELLQAARKSPSFRRRCESAATLAWGINHLREVNAQRASEVISFHARVKKLAEPAGVRLSPILKWFGVRTLSLADPPAALARFGRELGFTEHGLYEYLRIGEALALGHRLPVAGRGSLRKVVDQIQWQPETSERLHALKEAIHDEYARPEF